MEDHIRQRLNAGLNREAFELLVSEFQHKVYRLAVAMLGDAPLAEETAQEVFLRVWKSLDGYRGQSSLSTWIYAIARNACLTAAKSRSARPSVSMDQPGILHAAETRLASEWTRRDGPDVGELVACLPEKYRQVLALYYMEDRSYEEVSRLLGLPLGTVKTYLFRARKQLAAAAVRNGFGMEVR